MNACDDMRCAWPSAEKNMVRHIMKSVMDLAWFIILNPMMLTAHQGMADSTKAWKPTST